MSANDNGEHPTIGWPEQYVALTTLLQYAEKNFPGRQIGKHVIVGPFKAFIKKARRSRNAHMIGPDGMQRQAPGTVLINLPNSAIDDLNSEAGDAWFLCRIRRPLIEKMRSPILTPGEIKPKGSGGIIR